MNTHSLCTQNALHSPASVQITLAGSLPVTQKSTIPLGSEFRNLSDARRTVRITQYRRRRSKSPARATCPYYRGLRDARRVAVPKTTRAGIAAWRICRYNLDTVPDGHANKAVEAGVQTSCPFQYNLVSAVQPPAIVVGTMPYIWADGGRSTYNKRLLWRSLGHNACLYGRWGDWPV